MTRFDGRGVSSQRGTTVIASLASLASTNISVTFPVAFDVPPFVTVITQNSRLTVGANAVTTTGFNLAVSNWSNGVSPSTSATWVAVDA